MLTLEELQAEQHTMLLLLKEGKVVRIKNMVIQLGILPEYRKQYAAS